MKSTAFTSSRLHHRKNKTKLCYVLLLLVVFTQSSSAGIFSTLTKLSKTAKNADIDVPHNKLELPDNLQDLTATNIKLDTNKEWSVVHVDGTTTHIDSFVQKKNNIALIIQQSSLPRSIHQIDLLPDNMPILIQGKHGRLFTYQRGKPASLSYKNVLLQVKSMDEIRDGLWLLQRPPISRSPRFVNIDEKAKAPLPNQVPNSSLRVESIAAESLINSMHSFKYQTLILSGKIENGKLLGKDLNAPGVSLKKLQQLANDKDINLVVLESDRPALVLKKLSASMKGAFKNLNLPYDTTGDLFNRLRDPSSAAPVVLSGSRSGTRQVAIQWKQDRDSSIPNQPNLSAEILKGMPLHLLIQSAKIHLPDQQRSQELEDRIIPGISSWIQFYAIFSVILGFITPTTSWRLWKKIWTLKPRNEFKHLLLFLSSWLLHRFLFLIPFMPLLGGVSFAWFLILTTYRIVNFTLFRPIRWIYSCLNT